MCDLSASTTIHHTMIHRMIHFIFKLQFSLKMSSHRVQSKKAGFPKSVCLSVLTGTFDKKLKGHQICSVQKTDRVLGVTLQAISIKKRFL